MWRELGAVEQAWSISLLDGINLKKAHKPGFSFFWFSLSYVNSFIAWLFSFFVSWLWLCLLCRCFALEVCMGTETEPHPRPSPWTLYPSPPHRHHYCPRPRRLTLVNVDSKHNVLMSTTRSKQKEGFGPSPIQGYKVCSPCRYKPSAESLESIVCLSSILPQYYRRHCSPSSW